MTLRRDALGSLGLAVIIAAAACTGSNSETIAEPSLSAVFSEPDDTRPLLGLFYLGSVESLRTPGSLPELVVYPDGDLLVTRVVFRDGGNQFDDDEGPASYQFVRHKIDPRRLDDQLLPLAIDAGLDTGVGFLPIAHLPPDGIRPEDGGHHSLTLRRGDDLAGRQFVHLGSWEETGDRAAAETLVAALQEQRNRSGGEVVEPMRWVIFRAAAELASDHRLPEWSGPDLDSLDWKPVDGVDGLECALHEQDRRWSAFDGELVRHGNGYSDGTMVWRRPLLPHEWSCAEVVELRTALGLTDEPIGRWPEPFADTNAD